MFLGRPDRWLVAAATSGVVALVAASVVFVDPTFGELLTAALTVWVPLSVAFGLANADPARLSRFTVVFCGSLVGLTLLVSLLPGSRILDVALLGLAEGRLAVPINPVMAVLVGGASALAYYGVFAWGPNRGGNDGVDSPDGRAV
jgi:hypothetical protein